MPDWQQACEAIRQASGVLLVTHRNPDGDGIGSQIGLYHALKDEDKQVRMHNLDGVPRIYRFLEGADMVTSGDAFPAMDDSALIISLDCGNRRRLGLPAGTYERCRLLNIDHHASNPGFGSINLVDADACATGALVFELIRRLALPLSAAAASGLYVAIMTDTGNFRHANATSAVFRMTADLIDAGARPAPIAGAVYENNTPGRLGLLSACLQTLELHDGGRSAWLHVTPEMYQRTHTDMEDTEGFVEYARAVQGIEVAVFIRPDNNDSWKASLRSKNGADVGSLAESLGGGGHRFAAGCALRGSLAEVTALLRTSVSTLLG